MKKKKPLVVNLLIPLAAGGVSALLTMDSMKRYGMLRQPPYSPPGWAFPVVWAILYLMMGFAAYLVWERDSTGRNGALFLYGLQLIFNVIWPILFFNLGNYRLSLFWIIVLWVLILITTVRFFKEKAGAGWLMIPYLLWTAFAAYLNAGILMLNT